MVSSEDALTRVKNIPGWKWINDHWAEGPFWLVPLNLTEDAHWSVNDLLRASECSLDALYTYDGWGGTNLSVYLVSEFTYEMILWHETEDHNVECFQDGAVGPFATRPTASDIVEALPKLTGLSDNVPEESIEELMTTLRRVDPAYLCSALSALCGTWATGVGDGSDIVKILNTAAAVACENATSTKAIS